MIDTGKGNPVPLPGVERDLGDKRSLLPSQRNSAGRKRRIDRPDSEVEFAVSDP